jgi:hypothetical protein
MHVCIHPSTHKCLSTHHACMHAHTHVHYVRIFLYHDIYTHILNTIMFMHVCVYYVFMCVCVYIYIHTHTILQFCAMCTNTHAYILPCVLICLGVYVTQAYLQIIYIYTHIHTHMFTHTCFIHTYIHTYIRTCLHTGSWFWK